LQRFFEEWTVPGHVPGRWAANPKPWWSLKPTPPDEVRATQRAFGVVFLLGAVGLPSGVWALVHYQGNRISGFGIGVVSTFSVFLLATAVLLLRTSFKRP
jgi:hypothetical protein